MSHVFIQPDAYEGAARLERILGLRRIATKPSADAKEGGFFVCSKAFEEKLGGAPGLVAAARTARMRAILVVDEAAPAFAVVSEMGGKLIRLALPRQMAAVSPEFDFGAQLAAALIGGPRQAIACDAKSTRLLEVAERVARSEVTVFINGPTGTGKEVLSQFVHDRSTRSTGPFVAINCAAIPENMLEAILFGHEKGAFTGASAANVGIFRAADGGTLLLDEISEMPLGLQAKLLRVLQERTVTPLGASKAVAVNVRVVATSNRDMPGAVARGTFREDLFYRLNVFPLMTDALSERVGDILPIVTALLLRHHSDLATLPWLSQGAIDRLVAHAWPGNVRELDNVVQRALVLHANGEICADDIILDIPAGGHGQQAAALSDQLYARQAV